jgi:hypothetical protein
MAEKSMLRQQYLAISQGKESFDNYTSRFLGQRNLDKKILAAVHWVFLRMLRFCLCSTSRKKSSLSEVSLCKVEVKLY